MKAVLRLTGTLVLALVLLASALHISNSGQNPAPPKAPGTVRVATHNVHYIVLRRDEGAWSVGDWNRRKGPLDDMFKAIEADIFAFQEMESFAGGSGGEVNLTLDHLLGENSGYAAAAVGDWREFPSTQPILFRKDRFRVLDQGWFFFSETPEVIYSRTFDGSYPAFASWARFAPRGEGRPFYVFNVHFEYKSRSNRTRSAELVRERIAALNAADEPVFLLGDVNDRVGSRTVGILERAGLTFSPVAGATYHFNRGINLFGAIDHLAITSNIALAVAPVVLRQRFRGEWPSDHYPVFADFRLPD
ncbi:endonuclease/exonuclease/phosphatase family protein [Albidovulum aquaemixtae]|nr:endonuclease/exonuclease/phosphatase family protein [Defluviimonas aquaemixtae]